MYEDHDFFLVVKRKSIWISKFRIFTDTKWSSSVKLFFDVSRRSTIFFSVFESSKVHCHFEHPVLSRVSQSRPCMNALATYKLAHISNNYPTRRPSDPFFIFGRCTTPIIHWQRRYILQTNKYLVNIIDWTFSSGLLTWIMIIVVSPLGFVTRYWAKKTTVVWVAQVRMVHEPRIRSRSNDWTPLSFFLVCTLPRWKLNKIKFV